MGSSILRIIDSLLAIYQKWREKKDIADQIKQRETEQKSVDKTTVDIKKEVIDVDVKSPDVGDLNQRFGWEPGVKIK